MARTLVSKNTFVGEIRTFAGTTAPTGFMVCDGSPVSRTQFAQLFSIINTTYGDGTTNADGTASGLSGTHFNLPDYRGYFLRGYDGTAGRDADKLTRTAPRTGATAVGNVVGSVQADQITGHNHIDGFGGTNSTATYGVASVGTVGNLNTQSGTTTANHALTSTTGGNETRPKNATVLYCIKY